MLMIIVPNNTGGSRCNATIPIRPLLLTISVFACLPLFIDTTLRFWRRLRRQRLVPPKQERVLIVVTRPE